MIEIGHDDLEAFSLLSNQVLNWHLHIFKVYPGGTSSPLSTHLHLLSDDSFASWNQEDGDSLCIAWLA